MPSILKGFWAGLLIAPILLAAIFGVVIVASKWRRGVKMFRLARRVNADPLEMLFL